MVPVLPGNLYCIVKSLERANLCITYPASVALLSKRLSASIRALRHPWLRLSRHLQGTS